MQYFLVVIMLLLASCQSAPTQPTLGDQDMPSIRYLALGDSYTIGESVSEQERWPDQLATLLQAEGIPTEVTIIARTGWTTSELWEGIQARQIQPPYDLVSLLVGVNNQYRGYSIDEYREQFTFLLNKAIEYTGGKPERVIVLSIPDWGVTPFAADRDTERIAQEVDAFNSVNRGESEKAGVRYIDVTPISRMATAEASLIAEDGLHPAGKMYAMWADQVLPVARAILQ